MKMILPPAHTGGTNAVRECPRAWRLADRTWGLGLSPRIPESALSIGRTTHRILSGWLLGGKRRPLEEITNVVLARKMAEYRERLPGVVFSTVEESLVEDAELIQGMMAGYYIWLNSGRVGYYDDKFFEVVEIDGVPAIEYSFHVYWNGIVIGGKFDALLRDTRTGLVWVKEYKTCRSIAEMSEAVRWDLQPILYQWAGSELGLEMAPGVLYDLILKTNPVKIDLLNNGLPTKALATKLRGTTYEIYKAALDRAIKETGENEGLVYEKYQNVLDELKGREPGNVRRQALMIPPGAIERHLYYLLDTVERLMVPNAICDVEDTVPFMNRWHCPKCKMADICRAIEDGLDWKEVASRDFFVEEIS